MSNLRHVAFFVSVACFLGVQGCATKNLATDSVALSETSVEIQADVTALDAAIPTPDALTADTYAQIKSPLFQPLSINQTRQTGTLESLQLSEVSGISASQQYPGVLYAINDSGNNSTLFAISESGNSVAQWTLDSASNRDWEDMSRINLQGASYLVIGDTGDNRFVHDEAILYLVPEPDIPASSKTLTPTHIITFTFDEGPRNIEAFGAVGTTLYLLSKEPINASGRQPHRVYALDMMQAITNSENLVATRIATMSKRSSNFESWLAAALVDVDLSHPTALEFDEAANTAYVLTYREVLRFRKQRGQSWPQTFAKKADLIWSHRLSQAEALTVSPGRALWITSEGVNAPLWAIPVRPPS